MKIEIAGLRGPGKGRLGPVSSEEGPQGKARDSAEGASLGSPQPLAAFSLPAGPRGHPGCHPPDKIAAEDEAEHEDEDARAEDDHVDVERQVLETDGWHGAGLVGTNQSQATETPCKEGEREKVIAGDGPPGLMVLGRPGWKEKMAGSGLLNISDAEAELYIPALTQSSRGILGKSVICEMGEHTKYFKPHFHPGNQGFRVNGRLDPISKQLPERHRKMQALQKNAEPGVTKWVFGWQPCLSLQR